MRRLVATVLLAAAGAWLAYALLDGRAKNGLTMDQRAAAVMFAGAAILAPIPYLTGITTRMAERNAEFWSPPVGLTKVALVVSLGLCASLVWILTVTFVAT